MTAQNHANLKLTPLAKGVVTATVLAVFALTAHHYELERRLFPERAQRPAAIPPSAELPAFEEPTRERTHDTNVVLPGEGAGCAHLPEVRLELWAWNAQMGLLHATGGSVASEGSLMCKHGVNLHLVRQDDPAKMRADLALFATELAHGARQPKEGAHFVAIMGDGSAAFLTELNEALRKIGPEHTAKVVGSAGYSWGEDKLMGPPAWRNNPALARGSLVAGVLRDGDWNIAEKWLAENRLCNNPDERTWDAECMNWLATNSYVEAAEQYVAGYCETRKVVRHGKATGETKNVCVDGVVTWTPGDVTIAKNKGGLVSIVSTKEYRGQMPNVLIGIDSWMKANRKVVEGMLAATFEGADEVKRDPKSLAHAAKVSAAVYREETPEYWAKYFVGTTEKDKTGLDVELGGSKVNGLADNLHLFGMQRFMPGATNLFAATYTVFGNVVSSQYPDLLPRFDRVESVVDLSYLETLAEATRSPGTPDVAVFSPEDRVKAVVSRGDWQIEFETGSARLTRSAERTMDELLDQLAIAGGMLVEVHGHTDAVGSPEKNMTLSEERAFAVKTWLETKAPANFPKGRVRVFAHGQQNPVAPNATPDGRAKNRRVEIVLGTSDRS